MIHRGSLRIRRGGVLPVAGQSLTGLDWDGTAPGRRMLYWHSPPAAYGTGNAGMTYLFKVFQRAQVANRLDGTQYYTNFFWGNDGAFSGYFYGAHPYPVNADGSLDGSGAGKFEISTHFVDYLFRDSYGGTQDQAGIAAQPNVTNNQWYPQAFKATRSGSVFTHKYFLNLPSVAAADTMTFGFDDSTWLNSAPATPAIVIGQAPDNGAGLSWGGYSGWEEQNAIIRGIQIYDGGLSEAHIVALSALDSDAAVLAYCTANSLAAPWYLNMNPTPTDVTDKSGNGHHGSWAGAERPALWEA